MEPRERNEEEQEGEVSGFLLDTHYWLWLQMGNAQRLDGKGRRELLEMQERGALYLSAMSVWRLPGWWRTARGFQAPGGPVCGRGAAGWRAAADSAKHAGAD